MASILLSTAAAGLGSSLGLGTFGTAAISQLGSGIGGFIDNALFGPTKLASREGPRLNDLAVQSSTYGKMIPIVYGAVRIGGNIIWSRPIKETATTTSSSGGGGKGGGGKVTQSTTTYSYSASLAIAICEGPITEVLRVWADAKQLDVSQGVYRVYKGDEEQQPDPFIEGFEGVGKVPAYRGLAYVVIEDFPLADFGNRIPNFTFEVKKKALFDDFDGQPVEEQIEAMVMIPGAGEFVYDTDIQYKIGGEEVGGNWAQAGNQQRINQHNTSGKANALLALDQLEETCPNVEWVSVVVCWFGDSLDAGSCVVKPGVEYQDGATTTPNIWQVGSFNRSNARQITIEGDTPRYGGTPDDESLLRYLDELKGRGYNVLFMPLMFMDVANKPWRGRLTGSPTNIENFFTKTNGYNAFITHYANLVKTKVDAFAIGSEMVGLTKVSSSAGVYPAVDKLVALAATVRGIMGGGVKLTYGADWSEYHHTDGGWYNLDPLWASSNIDFVGIDAYFPLTDSAQQGYDLQPVIDGWTSGEGYDFYYSDPERTVQAPLSAAYAWKNIAWWWSNTHTNPGGGATSWVPESKKIWFTEFGFPSVDGAANQPNVFYDPTSSESYFPYQSRGRVDFRAQRQGIAGTLAKWKDSDMVERAFLWTWDARPFPYWPDLLNVWSDGGVWKTGHWVQGKLGLSNLAAIVASICERVGLSGEDYDVSRLTDLVEGYVIAGQQAARALIEQLMAGYFFDAVESDGLLKFVPRGGEINQEIEEGELLPRQSKDSRELMTITRQQELELPQRISVVYMNRSTNYQSGTQQSQRLVTDSRAQATVSLPIVFADQQAKAIADITLFNAWMGRTHYALDLPMKYARLEPTDIITVQSGEGTHTLRIVSTHIGSPGIVRIRGVAEDISTYDFYTAPGSAGPVIVDSELLGSTRLELLDLPAFPNDVSDKGTLRFAASGLAAGWRGTVIYRSDDAGANYARISDIDSPAVFGTALTALPTGPTAVFDITGTVDVAILGTNELESATEYAVLNGANACLIGDELLQYTTATLLSPGKYRLSGLLRGRLGSEFYVDGHSAGELFVLLDGRLAKDTVSNNLLNLPRHYKPVTIGATLGSTSVQDFTYTGRALKPYSPVHITGERDGDDLTIRWVRRTRLGGDWRDGVDVPLSEVSERYEIDILDGSDVVRTLTSVTPEVEYSAADQTVDFGSPQSSVSVKIYQMSVEIGRGYPGVAMV